MKIKNYSGYATINKSVASKQLTLNNLKTLGLALVVGAFSSAAIAQQTQDTVILTTGTSWTIPADADPSSISIECWGAGGGGAYTTNSKSAGGGGGGGAYAQKTFTSFTIGQEINYEIGTGGSGGTGTNAGGDTWFFEDDAAGVKAQGGRGVANDSKTGAAGGSGAASFGDTVFNGGKGGNGSYTSGAICGDEQASGGGGAAATLTANGIGGGNASSQTGGVFCAGNHSTAGTGGSNELFSGYTSKGGNGVTYSGEGIAGTNGAGGSGAASNTYKGGDGGDGLIRITYNKLYQATYLSMNIGSTTWCPGETRDVTVTIKNTGAEAWIDGGGNDFNIGVKWNADADYFVRVDAENLAPGATRTYTLSVTAPNTSGNENLTFNVVQEGVSWFGGEYTSVGVDIKDVPDVDAGADVEICSGESVQLEGAGANSIPGFSYFEDFNGCNSTNCNGWTISGGYDPYIDNYYSGLSCSNSAANDNIWSGNPDSYVTSNSAIFTSNGQPAVFSFNYKTRNYNNNTSIPGAYCTFNVQWSTNGSTWNTISTFSNVSNLNCNPHTSTFTPPAGQPVYLRVHARRNNGDFLYSIDDISVTQADLAPTYSWSGGPIVSGANTLTPTVNPTTTTTYTLTTTINGCTGTDDVQVIVTNPSGDPSIFGDFVWNVYGYNGYDTDLSVNDYRGYYIQPDLGGGNLGVNTQSFWSDTRSPSFAGTTIDNGNLWNGCSVDDDYHTFTHKRKGFPCGNYTFTMNAWDDETRVIIDGVNIWSCDTWSGGTGSNSNGSTHGCETTNTFTVQLDADSEVEFHTFERTGGDRKSVDIVKSA